MDSHRFRILAVLAKLLHTGGGQRGLISVCTAGGMGLAAILEGVAQTASKPAETKEAAGAA